MAGFEYGWRNPIVRYMILVLCGIGFIGCKNKKQTEDPAGTVSKDDKSVPNSPESAPIKRGVFVPNLQGRPIPVISMYVEEYGPLILPQNFEWHPVLLSVWSNGDIIYSHDYVEGGRPYYSAKVSPQQVESFVANLSSSELWKKFPNGYSVYGPDSSFMTLVVIGHDRAMIMRSWDELFEANGKTVGTAHGITSLEGRTIQEVLAEQPQEFRDYRQLWDMIRTGAKALIPKEGIETDPNWIEDRWSSIRKSDSKEDAPESLAK